ncbi:MAG: diaminopimelate epimerase [Acidobacteria bacterium]|nr:diaminopimelate epimerase [Acidobacteriota bacterium]
MNVPSEKWHACGNDFVLLQHDLSDQPEMSRLAQAICDRHEGVGSDGMVAYDSIAAAARCRIFNSDGSEAEISGNGVRCLAGLLKKSLPRENTFKIDSAAGLKTLTFLREMPPALWFRADMGQPDFRPSALPALVEGDDALPVRLGLERDEVFVYLVSMGNPHCVLFSPELPADWGRLGGELERHRAFPRRTNVEFVRVMDRHNIEVRIWERGVGKTFSSGTGSCASAVVAIQTAQAQSPVRIHTEKGELLVEWRPGQSVFIEGPAVPVWRGELIWNEGGPNA